MSRDSVFYNLVKDENSFTELLCNLLMHSRFRAQVLPLLCHEIPAASIMDATITTQEVDKDCGRPDIVIRTDTACAVVEVKLDPRRGLTSHQQLPGCNEKLDGTRYSDFLLKQNVPHRELVFLVPANWKNAEISQTHSAFQKEIHRIKVGICFWEHILEAVREDPDPFVQEFRKVLMRQLQSVTLSPSETGALRSQEFYAVFRAIRKVQIIIDRLRPLVHGNKEDTEAESYGFNVELNGKCQLWVGIWEIDGQTRLCYALPQQLCDVATREAFCQCFQNGEINHNIGTDKKWIVAPVPEKLLQDDDPVGRIKQQLKSIFERIPSALGSARW